MATYFVLAILVVLLGIVLMQLFKKPTPKTVSAGMAPTPDLANLKITDARRDDILSISGAGDNFSDLDFTIDHDTLISAGGWSARLLSGIYRDRRVTVRLTEGDDVELSIASDPSRLTLEDLGLAEEDLAEMDERQNTADSFEFDGKIWLYRRSREAQAHRDGQSQPMGFYYWEFQEQDGKRLLTIRKAEGEPFEVTMYTRIPAGDITVYRGSTAP